MENTFVLKELNIENIKEVFNYNVCTNKIETREILNSKLLMELGLEHAILYYYDAVITDRIENINIDIENIIEARFFNNDKELRVTNEFDCYAGTIFSECSDFMNKTKAIEEEYYLYPRYKEDKMKKQFASKLKVKKYIQYEADGQAYIAYVKPCELVFERSEINETSSN